MSVSLLDQWRGTAYNEEVDQNELGKFWNAYFGIEKGIYEQLLAKPKEEVKGTVKELAAKYDTDVFIMTGFLDGIDESLVKANPIETMTEDTEVSLAFVPTELYKNMVEAKAEWLYTLEQWDAILTKEEQKALYKEQKASGTIRKEVKVGRNDPCTCGSGKKFKKCCG